MKQYDAMTKEERGVKTIHDAKLDALEDIIEAANGKPVMIFTPTSTAWTGSKSDSSNAGTPERERRGTGYRGLE